MIFKSPQKQNNLKPNLKKKLHKYAGLSIPKSILNYRLIDFRYKKETKKKIFKYVLYTGLNSHFLSKWILEQYQVFVMDKATVHQHAFCSVLSPRSRSFTLSVVLVYFTNISVACIIFKCC